MATVDDPFAELALPDQQDLNAACDRFEEALQQGLQPRIEDFLTDVPGRLEAELFRELVVLECEYALRQGVDLDALPLIERFADRETCIREAMELARRNMAIESTLAEQSPAPAHPVTPPASLLAAPKITTEYTEEMPLKNDFFRVFRVFRGDSLPGKFGRFKLLEAVGQGAFGAVFRAVDTSDGSEVALKIPHIVTLVTPELRERFFREARAAVALDHPGIVRIRAVGEEGLVCYIAGEYVPGTTLAAWLHDLYKKQERMPIQTAARLAVGLAEAMQHAHERGVFHYDLKPANVLLRDGPSGSPVVTDFGLARLVGDPADLTRTGQILGTPAYMAPEQAFGPERVLGPGPDVYALGAILYEMLTGRPPHQGRTPLETLEQKRDRAPVSPRALVPRLPRDLETVCLKCLDDRPAKRYQSAALLADDLERWLRGERVRARRSGPMGRLWRACRRKPLVAALWAALLVALAAGLAGVLYQWQMARAARDQALANEAQALADEAQAHQLLTELTGLTILGADLTVPLRNYPRGPSIELLLRAERHWRALLERRPDDSSVRVALTRVRGALGSLYVVEGQIDEATTWVEKVPELWEPQLRRDAANLEARNWLIAAHAWQADLCDRQGKVTERYQSLLRVEALRLELAEDMPEDATINEMLAFTGVWFNDSTVWGNPAPAAAVRDGILQPLRETRELLGKLVGESPANPVLRQRLGRTCCRLGDICRQDGLQTDALRYWLEAYEHFSQAAKTTHNGVVVDLSLSDCCLRLMRERPSGPYGAQAVILLERSAKYLSAVLERYPALDRVRFAQFQSELCLALCHWKAGHAERAQAVFERQLRGLRERAIKPPVEHRQADVLLSLFDELASALHETGQRAAWRATLQTETELIAYYAGSPSLDINFCVTLARSWMNVATARHRLGEWAEGLRQAEGVRNLWEGLRRANPDMLLCMTELSKAWERVAKIRWDMGKADEALGAFRESAAAARAGFAREPSPVNRLLVARCYERIAYWSGLSGDRAGAEAALLEREKLWPDEPERLLKVSLGFEELVKKVGPSSGPLTPQENAERQRYLEHSARIKRAAEIVAGRSKR